MNKTDARKLIRIRLKAMLAADSERKSKIISDRLIDFIDERKIKTCLAYMALDTEVNVSSVIEHCLNRGIDVFIPRVNGDNIEAVRYGKTVKGAFGIQEPLGVAFDIEADIVITPVMAVDIQRRRLGKGKGYYDRYFASHNSSLKVAAAFSEQVLDEIETDNYDINMDYVITDERTY